ncbi:hypothetical protein BTHI11S_03116 [Bosea thiooxidans]
MVGGEGGEFLRDMAGEFGRRDAPAALDEEQLRRVAALLLVAGDVMSGEPRQRRSLAAVERFAPDHAEADLVAMRQEAGGDRQFCTQCRQRIVAAIGHDGVGFTQEDRLGGRFPAFPPGDGEAFADLRVDLGEEAREPAGRQRLGRGELADAARLDQQSADQAPERERRDIAGPDMQQQIRAMGAEITALGCRLEAVEHGGIGEILRQEAQQLRAPKSLEITGQPEPDRLAVIAGDDRQQMLGLAAQRVCAVEQARDRGVNRGGDPGDRHLLQPGAGVAAHMRAERGRLCLVQFRQCDDGALAPGVVTDLAPAQRLAAQARQMARMLDHGLNLAPQPGTRPRRPSSPSNPRRRRDRAA